MNKWQAYEAYKKWLEGENLTPEEYEKELLIMAKQLNF